MYEFLKLEKATDGKHKYQALFFNKESNRQKTVKFGASGYNDYIIYYKTKGKEEADKHKEMYIKRHAKDNLDNPLSPGALSMFILWNKPTLKDSLEDYLKRFKNIIN